MIKTTKSYIENDLGFKAMSWCNYNGIKIYAVPLEKKYKDGKYGKNLCVIEIDQQGIKKRGTQLYKQETQLTDKILELYVHFFNRR